MKPSGGILVFIASRPIGSIMCALALVIGGLYSAQSMGLARLPAIPVPQVIVEARYPGLPAQEIRNLLAIPLEDALASVQGLQSMESTSRDSQVLLSLTFAWGESPRQAASRVRELVDMAWQTLPEGAERPMVLPWDPGRELLGVIAMDTQGAPVADLGRYVDIDVRGQLRRIEGIGSLAILGLRQEEIKIKVDPYTLANQGMGLDQLAQGLSGELADVPSGTIREGDQELVLVAKGRIANLDELSDVVFTGTNGPRRLGDMATIVDGLAEQKSLFVLGSRSMVALELYGKPGSNPVLAMERVKALIAAENKAQAGKFSLELVYDGSVSIAQGLTDTLISGILGMVAAAFALMVFLKNAQSATLLVTLIPLSLAGAVGVLALFDRSLNAMSMGGLALSVGIISDNGVVVLAALMARRDGVPLNPQSTGMALASVFGGTLGSTISTAIVFIPILFLPGPLGALYSDLSLALLAAVGIGWILAMSFLPGVYGLLDALAYRKVGNSAPKTKHQSLGHMSIKKSQSLESRFRKLLGVCIRKPLGLFGGALVLSGVGLLVLVTRPVYFLPPGLGTNLELSLGLAPGTRLASMESMAQKLGAELTTLDGVKTLWAMAGSEDDDVARRADPRWEPDTLVFRVVLENNSPTTKIIDAIKIKAETSLGPQVSVQVAVVGDPVAQVLGLATEQTVVASGSNPELARSRGQAFASLERGRQVYPKVSRPVLRIVPHREAQVMAGSSVSSLASTLRTASEGTVMALMERQGRDIPIRLEPYDRTSINLAQYPIMVGEGKVMAAMGLASFVNDFEPGTFTRLDRTDVVYIQNKIAKTMDVSKDASSELYAKDASAFTRYGTSIFITLVLVFILLYLSIGAQFESFSLPILILGTIPLALAGVGPALALGGQGLDSGSILGLVVLFGLVVNNAILIHEARTERLLKGQSPVVAAWLGAVERLRPVLTTTASTVLALGPMALFSTSPGQKSMALAMLGGLLASTVLSLFIIPVVLAHRFTKP